MSPVWKPMRIGSLSCDAAGNGAKATPSAASIPNRNRFMTTLLPRVLAPVATGGFKSSFRLGAEFLHAEKFEHGQRQHLVAATALSMWMYSLIGGQPSSPGPKVIAACPRSAKRIVSL